MSGIFPRQIVTVSGKWQRRIAQTLVEAGTPLTYRQIAIRCGMVNDIRGIRTAIRNAVMVLVNRGIVKRIRPGLFAR